jgi:mRNA-degrading endonuclease toxin of MazEF toxin-antitoxin module
LDAPGNVFIVCEGFNTPPFRAVKKVLNPETNTLPKQHTSPFRARYVDSKKKSKLTDDSIIIVAQLYAIDRGRFKKKISKVTKEIMEQVEVGVKLVLGINW